LANLRYNLTGQRESIFAMILSARAIASEIADSDAGEFLPSHCVNFRAARNAGSNQNHALSTLIHDHECSVFAFCSPQLHSPSFHRLREFARRFDGETASMGIFFLISSASSSTKRACGILA